MPTPPMADDLLSVPWKHTPFTLKLKPPLRLMRGPRPIRQYLNTRMSWIVNAAGHSKRAVVETLAMRPFQAERAIAGFNPGPPDRYSVIRLPLHLPLFGTAASAVGA